MVVSRVADARPLASPLPRAVRRGSTVALVLVALLILSVALSPRIRLPFLPERSIDLRVQDLLLPFALVVAAVVPRRGLGLRRWHWMLGFAFVWVAAMVTLLHEVAGDEPATLVRVAFLARGLEPFILAFVVARLVVAAGLRSSRWAVWALLVGVGANLLWFAYQLSTGEVGTLLGADVGALIESYGPKLVGEPSAFGAGAFWASTAALAVALYSTRTMWPGVAVALLACSAVAAYEAQSRIWVGAIVAFVILMAVRPGGDTRPLRVVLFTAVAVGVAVLVIPSLPANGRLSGAGVDASVNERVGGIWQPLMDAWASDPVTMLIGLGPGGVGTTGLTEAHDLVLRALLDYGLVGAGMLLIILWTVLAHARGTARDVTKPAQLRMWAEYAKLSIIGLAVAGLVQDSFTAVTSSHLVMVAVGLYAGAYALHRPGPRKASTTDTAADVPYPAREPHAAPIAPKVGINIT